jgi:NAD(P)-dependent dehydrogenase (short-subunit alcohol dehydrogenase family)
MRRRLVLQRVSARRSRGADIANEDQIESMFQRIDNELGTIAALVNSAGIAVAPQQRLEFITIDRLQSVFSVNVFGSFLCAKHAIRRMSSTHGGSGGSIVNISSVAARAGSPGEYIDYAASKGAIDTMTLGLSKEVASEGVFESMRYGRESYERNFMRTEATPGDPIVWLMQFQ